VSAAGWIVVVLAIIAVIVLVVWFTTSRHRPDRGVTLPGDNDPDSATYRTQGPTYGRPADPGAEDMLVERAGDPQPGPTPAAPPRRDEGGGHRP
jgi:hypothetical protein